ncbi:hypothetical protein [Marispirochaeta sp.]|uniref:hypothetical protein n=1 Tax=Marispirochaeta sp. TaxID=2038653 RepID=UPI0029C9A103|nr:hypothetical protein [Marispirochaeta sp.]
MKKFFVCIIFLVTVFMPVSLVALDNNGVDVTIRLYDKRIYYPESEIQVLIEISNNTSETFRFKSAHDRRFNVDFNVTTLTNEPVKHSEQFITARQRNQHVYYRDISIEPGERFSFVESLKDYIAAGKPGAYVAQVSYYPELRSSGTALRSNLISFTVRPSEGPQGIQSRIDAETGEILRRQPLPPDEVVEYFIRSRQKEEWNKFFLYLNVESLMLDTPEIRRRYDRAPEADRLGMVENFREALRQRETRDEILLIPVFFEILETRYTPTQGTVRVREKFQNPDFIEVKEFVYYLNRRDDVWLIGSYDVRNLGSE